MKRQSKRAGFTMIEIMIVLAIIGILAMALLPNLVGADRPARIVTSKSNLQTLRVAIQTFRAKEKRYPKADLSDLLTETYKDLGTEQHYLLQFPRELISDSSGRNTVSNTLGIAGGWYYDTKTATVRINYNKDLETDWDMDEGEEANPSKW